MRDRQLLDDPVAFIQASGRGGRLYWTSQVNRRRQGRDIPRQAVIEAVDTSQRVEVYPADQDRPSDLILARDGHDAFHRVCAIDLEGDHVSVVSAYRPSLDEWEADGNTRRPPRCRVRSVEPRGH